MRRFVLFFLIALCVGPSFCVAADLPKTFQEANTSYRTGDYAKASELYESLIAQEPRRAVFYYNLGNAYVRLGALSKAILNYEKALLLDPRNADIRANLNYARGLLEYRVEDTRNWYIKATGAVLRSMTEQEVNTVALATLFIFLAGGILFFLRGRGVFWSFWRRFLFMILLIAGLVVFGKQAQDNLLRDAVVMQKECEARYGPSEHDQVAFRMGEGIKVFVVDRREDWSRVLLTNGESGWVKDSDIAEVKI
ncbi:MAG TPA: tetratricopeptide repeat protein [Candidatus Omnitrophota bacterium]|nr:tetratricopeptide repeat protein [Candidatus Omnitrophota bacterium]HRY85269.1 tetratricopeptide repeat protein [Candidatus Omnitrophota bacterium]